MIFNEYEEGKKITQVMHVHSTSCTKVADFILELTPQTRNIVITENEKKKLKSSVRNMVV